MYIAKSKLLHVSRLLAWNLEFKVILTFELSLYEYINIVRIFFPVERAREMCAPFQWQF